MKFRLGGEISAGNAGNRPGWGGHERWPAIQGGIAMVFQSYARL